MVSLDLRSLGEVGDPIVVFVGAGASALPPSLLPTWPQFNDLLLECLGERLSDFSRGQQPVPEILSVLRGRRDATHFFAPDFQAQLIEEEIGQAYFHVWQSLETTTYGPVHAALAELSSRGGLAAIVTLNFDRLIETALVASGQAFEVYHDASRFDALPAALERVGGPVPVVKVHGSIEDTASLVDTLRQRVAGRPKSLASSLRVLLREHRWLFLGFSGADLDYDPQYLGIMDAAPEARGFVFLARQGQPIRDGVRALANAYGPEKSSIVQGDLAGWLNEAFDLPSFIYRQGAAEEEGSTQRVVAKIRQWVETLGPVAVVNVMYAMLRSAGLDSAAHWLVRRTWKSYRAPVDSKGKSYARFNYNYGLSLRDAGLIFNPVSLADDMGNLLEWKAHADQNAFEFFARSYRSGEMVVAGAQLASVLAYRGEVGRSIGLASTVTDEAARHNDPLEMCDVALASVVIYDIAQFFRAPALQLRQCLELARRVGDEPRRALLCAQLGRLLTYAGEFVEADAFITEADRIARRLDLPDVVVTSRAARGLWFVDSGRSTESAVRALSDLADELRARDDVPLVTKWDLNQPAAPATVIKGRNPLRCRVLLDLNRAAMFARDASVIDRSLDELDELATDVFTGYCPHYYLAYAQCLIASGDEKQEALTEKLLTLAHDIGKRSGNPWVAQMVTFVREHADMM